MTPLQIVEKWLQQTLQRHVYIGKDVHKDIAELLETLGPNDKTTTPYVEKWRDATKADAIYSANEIQDCLFEVWGLIHG